MRIEALTSDRINDFIYYCKKHKNELDDSFLYDEDLKNFKPDNENPTYICINDKEEITGTASLIIDEYNRRGKKGRFRLFHSEYEDIDCYKKLLDFILTRTDGIDKIFIFIPVINIKLINIFKELRFTIERYSFLLIREEAVVPKCSLPAEYSIRALRPGTDENVWCEIRNISFKKLKGSETPITEEMVQKMINGDDYIEGGCMVLYHGEKPVGVVRGSRDEYEGSPIMNIGPLAIMPEYQQKGLGRSLLRAALQFAKDNSYDKTVLCVNADNERAKKLYIDEGFKQVEAVVALEYYLK